MKKIVLLIAFFVFQKGFCTEIFSINLAKNEKLEGSFSVANTKNETTHFLFIKNSDTKKYVIKPFFLSENKTVKELESVTMENKPNFIANYSSNNHLIVASYDEDSKNLLTLNFDLVSGKNTLSEKAKYEKPDVIFSQTDKIVLVKFIENGKKVSLDFISNSGELSNKTYTPSETLFKEFKAVAKNAPDAINQNEFVENGSIKDERAYLDSKNLYFTKENSNKTTSVYKFDLNDVNGISSSNFDFNLGKESKDHNTYIFNENLVSVSSSYDDIVIKNYDLNSNKLTKELNLSRDLKSVLDKNAVDKFLSEEKKINLKVTATINKTKDNKSKVRLGRVNENDYTYYYNWWWFHNFMMQQMQMQQMFQMQQMARSAGRGFGPVCNYEEVTLFYDKKEKYQTLEFIVDANFNVEKDSNVETEFKNTDKDEVLEEFNKDKSIKNFTSVFLDNEMRYIYQNNKTKTVYINFKSL